MQLLGGCKGVTVATVFLCSCSVVVKLLLWLRRSCAVARAIWGVTMLFWVMLALKTPIKCLPLFQRNKCVGLALCALLNMDLCSANILKTSLSSFFHFRQIFRTFSCCVFVILTWSCFVFDGSCTG